jgi:hypothetical protein
MFVVAAVSLNAVAWAIIALLRNLLTPGINPLRGGISYQTEIIALQMAMIIIGLPIFLAHWLWAQRLAARDEEEHGAVLRRLYLYVMMGAFLVPIFTNVFGFVQSGLRLLLGVALEIPRWSVRLPDRANLLYTAVALIILALLWAYHHWVAVIDRSQVSETDVLAVIHRLYVYLFSLVGLVMLSIGVGSLLRWLLFQVNSSIIYVDERSLATALAMLLVGLAVWLYFWRKAEKMFAFGGVREQAAALRKFYLYLVIFLAALGVVGSLTTILAGIFRERFSLRSTGDSRNVLTVLVVTAVIWAYHFFVLRQDTRVMPEVAEQAGVRRLYWYLIAGIGLLALLIGIGGDISVLIRSGGDFIGNSLKEQVSWFTAVLLAGLVVWIVPWRKIQAELLLPEPDGLSARDSVVRRLYLYFYLLIATLTFLGTSVYVLAQVLDMLLGERTSGTLATDVAQAVAYGLIAVIVWLYHGKLLRDDTAVLKQVVVKPGELVHVAVVDDEDGSFGQRLINALHQAIPNAILHPIGLTAAAKETLHTADDLLPAREILSTARIIVGPWTMATPYVIHGETDMEMLAAVSASPARKLLIPKPEPGWDWAGVGTWEMDTAVKQTIFAVKQFMAGQPIHGRKGFSAGMIIGIIIGVFLLLQTLLMVLSFINMVLFGFG